MGKYIQHLYENNLAGQIQDNDKMITPKNNIVSVYDYQAEMLCPEWN